MKKLPHDPERNIRKDEYRTKFFKLLDEDIDSYVKPFHHEFVEICCPNCDHHETHEEFKKNFFSFHLCPVCDTVFVNPRPSEKVLENFYAKSAAIRASTQSLFENEKGRRKYIFLPRSRKILATLKDFGVENGSLMEIGCSIGTFLKIIKEMSDFLAEGIDPSLKAGEICRKRGLKVHRTKLENYKMGNRQFDVVVSFETIEHTFSPINFMRKINQITKSGGIFIFSTPNYHGFDMMVLGKYYKNIHAPSHLNYFNIDTIDLLMGRVGFKVIKKMTPGFLDLTIVRKQIEEGISPDVSPLIKHWVFDLDDQFQKKIQRFLANNGLSGNMLVFAMKKGDTQ